MTSLQPTVSDTSLPRAAHRPGRLILWGLVGLTAQVSFTAGWVVTETWQRAPYSIVTATISDMQAAGAPHVWFPITCFAIGGIGSFAFVLFGLRPATAPAGQRGMLALVALAIAVLALGNSFPLIPCQLSGPGCTAHRQLHSAGGTTDAILATLGFLVVSFSPKLLWPRLELLPLWRGFAPVARLATVVCPGAFFLLCAASLTNAAQGLAERLLVSVCVLWLGSLAAYHIAAVGVPADQSQPLDEQRS